MIHLCINSLSLYCPLLLEVLQNSLKEMRENTLSLKDRIDQQELKIVESVQVCDKLAELEQLKYSRQKLQEELENSKSRNQVSVGYSVSCETVSCGKCVISDNDFVLLMYLLFLRIKSNIFA